MLARMSFLRFGFENVCFYQSIFIKCQNQELGAEVMYKWKFMIGLIKSIIDAHRKHVYS